MCQLCDLNQVRYDLEDYLYHEPAQFNNIVPKLWIISDKLRDKIAKARHLIFCSEQMTESYTTTNSQYIIKPPQNV